MISNDNNSKESFVKDNKIIITVYIRMFEYNIGIYIYIYIINVINYF